MKPFFYNVKRKSIFGKRLVKQSKSHFYSSSSIDNNSIPTIDMTTIRRGTPGFERLETHFREHFVVKKKPVILRGLANDWSAVSNWNKTPKYVKKKYGKRNVQIQFSK